MALFVQRFCTDDVIEPELPGTYSERLRLRVDETGQPVVQRMMCSQSAPLATTVTKATTDRDDAPETLLGTKTGAGPDHDDAPSLLGTSTRGGPDRDDTYAFLGTITFSGPDRDD